MTLEEKLEELLVLIQVQSRDGTWDINPYTHGILNGLISAYAILADMNPEEVPFVEQPDKYLEDIAQEEMIKEENDAIYRNSMEAMGWRSIW